jgi:hypothetical protein
MAGILTDRGLQAQAQLTWIAGEIWQHLGVKIVN